MTITVTGALGYTLPYAVLAAVNFVAANSVTVVDNAVDATSSAFAAQSRTEIFTRNFPRVSSRVSRAGAGDAFSGVADSGNRRVAHTVVSVPAPEPASMVLLGAGRLGLGAVNRRRA